MSRVYIFAMKLWYKFGILTYVTPQRYNLLHSRFIAIFFDIYIVYQELEDSLRLVGQFYETPGNLDLLRSSSGNPRIAASPGRSFHSIRTISYFSIYLIQTFFHDLRRISETFPLSIREPLNFPPIKHKD